MRDAIADLVRDGDTRRDRGLHPPHLVRGRPRDHPPAPARPDPRPADAGPHLRPDDRGRRRPQARLLVARQPGRRRARAPSAAGSRATIPDEPLEVEEYSHFGMVGRYTAGAMNLPFFPLRSYFETDLPVANPLIRPIASPYGDETDLRRPAAPAGRHDRPRPARVGRRRHPGLGPARLPEGGGLRRRPGHRRRRGARRRGGHPGRPEPDDHPGPDRRRRRRRAVGRASVVRPGRLRPRQPVLPRLGSRSPATRRRPRRGCASGSTTSTAGRPTSRSSGAERVAALEPGPAPSGSVDYGAYR